MYGSTCFERLSAHHQERTTSWPSWLRFGDVITCFASGSDRRLYWSIPSRFTQAAREEAGIFLCAISARFRAMAFPTFFHTYMPLTAAFQFRIWSRPSSSLNNFVPSSSRLSHGPSSSETSSHYFLGYTRTQSPGWYRYNLKTVSFQMSSTLWCINSILQSLNYWRRRKANRIIFRAWMRHVKIIYHWGMWDLQ
jgi:hypothetical protein